MRRTEEYINGLRGMRRNLYFEGNKIDRDDERQMDALHTIGLTFDAAFDKETEEICTVDSHISGEKINRFCHIHQTAGDLHKKQDMTRILCRKAGFCIQRCMGTDAANALYAVTYEADKANGGSSNYHENFKNWLKEFQERDLIAACAQTDAKGERTKRPSGQTDPDAYLRVVEKKNDGIVVRGCKMHISSASTSDEIIVVPTRALMPNESDYAVAFSIPADHEGIKQIVTVHEFRKRKRITRGMTFSSTDSYVIFEDAFIPWERVFLCGETDHAGICAMLFALFHRHSYSGCKPAVGDIILGLVALMAEYNGIDKAKNVKELYADLIKVIELGYAAGFTASAMSSPQIYIPGFGNVDYGPGNMIPNSIYSNVGRCFTGESVFKEQEILCTIAGGLPATFPRENDLVNPEIKHLVEKYLNRNPNVPIEDQIKLFLLYTEYTCSTIASCMAYAGYHGGGSPIMEQIAITGQYDIELRKRIVKDIAGIE